MWYNIHVIKVSSGAAPTRHGGTINSVQTNSLLKLFKSNYNITKGITTMFTRKEYESYFGKVSDAEWANVQKSMGDAMDRMYEEDHPLCD